MTATCGEKVQYTRKCDQWFVLKDKSYLPSSSRLFLFEQAIACLDLF